MTNTHPLCSGGRRCVCDGTMPHEHCICRDPLCQCHQPDAYRMELTQDGSGREFYVPTGARLVVRKQVGA